MTKFISLALAATLTAAAQDVLQKSYDQSRTSERRTETVLTPAKVAAGMTMLPRIPCIGDARGCEAQPLIDGAVMVLASEANVIRGVRPADGAAIWQTQPLCVPVRSGPSVDMWGVQDHFGMMSTGVIDGDTHKLYQVATCSRDGSGSPASLTQRMFVLDDRTGAVLANTLLTGSDQGMNYADAPRKQRAALLLWQKNGVKFVIVMAGSFTENGANATGWLLAFDTFDNQFKAALSTKAGGWMSGEGPAEDMATGLIYLGLGNGPFDGVTKFGEAVMQIRFTPPSNTFERTVSASFSVQHAWAPFSDDARTCAAIYPATKLAGDSAPSTDAMGMSAAQRNVPGAAMPTAEDCSALWGDQDANLTGTLIPERNLYVSAGKDGITYLLNTLAFPDTKPADFANPKANCAKVGMYEAGWDLAMDPCPVNAPALNRLPGGKTRHQHAPIVQFHAADGTPYLLFFAENSPLQAWRVNPDATLSYVARGSEMASAKVQSGMPGGFCSVSSNAGANPIAWCSVPDGDANRTVTTGRLIAYDLSNLGNISSVGGIIPTLWTSAPYVFSKFSQPIIWNGQVYLADYAGSVMMWK